MNISVPRSITAKTAFFRRYRFVIVPENSVCLGGCYMSEKLLEASLSGAVPLYFGCSDRELSIFNPNRLILVHNISDAVNQMVYYSTNETAWIEKMKMPILKQNYRIILGQIEQKVLGGLKTALLSKGIVSNYDF
jgi:hypothetical protein